MSDSGSEFLSDIARKVAESDAKANADLADILAGRPFHRRVAKAQTDTENKPAPAKKPRAKRQPKKTT